MNIIEQAAKRRLEELKRAGIEVPPIPPAMPSGGSAAVNAGLPAAAAAAAATAAAAAVSEVEVRPVGAEPRTEEPATLRRSREVEVDLDRLTTEGYLVPNMGRSALAEQLRVIKRHLLANTTDAASKVIPRANLIQVVSAMPGEGKTFFAMNLAMSIAMEVDHSVLLVDADVLRPSVLARLGVEPCPGLMDVLGSEKMELADVMLRTNVPKLTLLPAGTANAKSTEMLASIAMADLLDELAAKYSDRIVVFDSPPLIPTTESRVLASRVGQVVMVVEADRTTHAQVAQAYAAVEKCPVVLSVLNKCTGRGVREAYGYHYAN